MEPKILGPAPAGANKKNTNFYQTGSLIPVDLEYSFFFEMPVRAFASRDYTGIYQ